MTWTVDMIPAARCSACRAGISAPDDCTECMAGEIASLTAALAERDERIARLEADVRMTRAALAALTGAKP